MDLRRIMLIYSDRRRVASFAPGEKYELQSILDVSGVRYRPDAKGLAHHDKCASCPAQGYSTMRDNFIVKTCGLFFLAGLATLVQETYIHIKTYEAHGGLDTTLFFGPSTSRLDTTFRVTHIRAPRKYAVVSIEFANNAVIGENPLDSIATLLRPIRYTWF